MEDAAIAKLGATTAGRLLGPGDAGYDQARRVWNGMIDKHPGLIIEAADADDVAP